MRPLPTDQVQAERRQVQANDTAQRNPQALGARRTIVSMMLLGAALIVASAWDRHPTFIWNASASTPVGLYRVQQIGRIDVADLVVLVPPEPLAGFLAERGYLPLGVPLIIKRVFALGGATVCRQGADITVHGLVFGAARERDRHGRRLPSWQGCRQVAQGQIFLMNPNAADSFDSRYFGPVPRTSVIGRAVPVWTFGDRYDVTASPPGRPPHGAPSADALRPAIPAQQQKD